METPVISKRQQKTTLSAKKSRPKGTIKNVLGTPYNNYYWPKITPEDHNMLKQILETSLPRMKEEKVNIPWRDIKSIPKSDRKKVREEYSKRNENNDFDNRDSEGLHLGVNNVTKLLENNAASIVLITSDIQPKLMVQHLIDQSVLYRIPVLVFDDLRSLLKTHCGISSLALGISKNISLESKVNRIKDSVENIYKRHPPPTNHINYNRFVDKNIVETDPKTIPTISKINEIDLRKKFHLRRVTRDERMFIPHSDKMVININDMESESDGFLAFPVESMTEKRKKSTYKSLIIKRLKGDSNRHKRKIKSMKKTDMTSIAAFLK